jgi:hypothetical protein
MCQIKQNPFINLLLIFHTIIYQFIKWYFNFFYFSVNLKDKLISKRNLNKEKPIAIVLYDHTKNHSRNKPLKRLKT